MAVMNLLQLLLYLALLALITRPLGSYLARVFAGERTRLDPVLRPVERVIYRLCGIDPQQEMRWTTYTVTMLLFNFAGLLLLYAMLRLQHLLPWNPQHIAAMKPDLSFNTAVSFTTNTNWQAYSGETAVTYFTQMAGLAWHNFASAATGLALAVEKYSPAQPDRYIKSIVRALGYLDDVEDDPALPVPRKVIADYWMKRQRSLMKHIAMFGG